MTEIMTQEFTQEEQMQFCLIREDGTEHEWIDPVSKIWEENGFIYVENYYNLNNPWVYPNDVKFKLQRSLDND